MRTVTAGGPEMPPKIDPYDMTTPSGAFPTLLSLYMWNAAKELGYDMRWYAVAKPIPLQE